MPARMFRAAATVTVVSSQPHETAGTYPGAATAPLYADGLLDIEVNAHDRNAGDRFGPVAPPPGSTSTHTPRDGKPGYQRQIQPGPVTRTHAGQLVAERAAQPVLGRRRNRCKSRHPRRAQRLLSITYGSRAWNSVTPPEPSAASGTPRQWNLRSPPAPARS